jgi:hypothetical protein
MKGLFLSIALVLSTSTNANVLVDIGSWVEGAGKSVEVAFNDSEDWVVNAAEDSETWVVNAAEDTWAFATHNPAVAIVSTIAFVGVTFPFVLSEIGMTVVTPLVVGYNFIMEEAASTIVQVGMSGEKLLTGPNLATDIYEMSPLSTPDMFLQTRNTTWFTTELKVESVSGILPKNPARVASYGGVMSALILGTGYAIYHIGEAGLRWSEVALNDVIGVTNDVTCWMVNGANEDCTDFEIGKIKIDDAEENKTDNTSFFKQIIRMGEDFQLGEEIEIN